ncbi:MAG: NAD(P)/FAD-dependent oxidoreductase, partial [Beijerinckiaceae bacterium]
MTERVLIIGNGMASVRLVERLLKHGAGRHAITVVGAEPEPGYNRVLLSALLAQDVTGADIVLRGRDWYADNGVRLITGAAVDSLDAAAGSARLATGETL